MNQAKIKFLSLGAQVSGDEFVFIASTSAPDRAGDRVFPSGIDLKNFGANPVLLYQHDHSKPIGHARVWVEGETLRASPTFATTALAQEVKTLVRDGALRAVSIGFIPTEIEPNELGGFDIKASELLEVSIVSVPMHPGAIREKSAEAEQLDELRRNLEEIKSALDELLMLAAETEEQDEEQQEPEPKSVTNEVEAFYKLFNP